MNTTKPRTTEIFKTFAQRDDFMGYGYIGERARHLEGDSEIAPRVNEVAAADELALRVAAEEGLTDEEFFEWANSKHGRWFADVAIGSGDLEAAYHRFGLTPHRHARY